ncbi:hypothetical protein DYY67_0533 [Candidatus Nitrosotalea sp. TS]|nr:hypothetical protein [Candidatus Nitrosotalea sp. TS]
MFFENSYRMEEKRNFMRRESFLLLGATSWTCIKCQVFGV